MRKQRLVLVETKYGDWLGGNQGGADGVNSRGRVCGRRHASVSAPEGLQELGAERRAWATRTRDFLVPLS